MREGGLTKIFKEEYAIINLGTLDALEGDTFNPDRLMELGVVRKMGEGLKVLGSGELTRAIHVSAHLFSKSAMQKIRSAGGTAEVIGGNAAAEQERTQKKILH